MYGRVAVAIEDPGGADAAVEGGGKAQMRYRSMRERTPTGLTKAAMRTPGFANPEQAAENAEILSAMKSALTPISELDLMIKMGYGDTPQVDLPADWRMRKNGAGR